MSRTKTVLGGDHHEDTMGQLQSKLGHRKLGHTHIHTLRMETRDYLEIEMKGLEIEVEKLCTNAPECWIKNRSNP